MGASPTKTVVAALAVAAAACGELATDGTLSPSDVGGAMPSPDGGRGPSDASPDVALPPVDADACSMEKVDLAHGAFASTKGTAAGCGAATAPCPTITGALDFARQNGRSIVYVDDGTYVEQVALPANLTVEGGWSFSGGAWKRACDGGRASRAIVQAPNDKDRTVVAAFAGSSTLQTLTIASKPQAAVQPGQSTFGVFVSGDTTVLTLRELIVKLASGGAGASGIAGGAGGGGAAGGCSPAGAGAPGAPGSAGAGGALGVFDQNGYTPGDGSPGDLGNVGTNGTAGPDVGQPGGPTCVNGGTCTSNAMDGACQAIIPIGAMSCGTPGIGGCPGAAGGGGAGGRGGGSSVAVYVVDGQVTIDTSALAPGNGGAGGAGGAAGAGGSGGAGASGQPGPQIDTLCASISQGQGRFTCNTVSQGAGAAGGPGGNGGGGGAGGAGGGGSGGSSYCFYKASTGTVTTTNLRCTVASGGAGGTGGTPGANGTAAASN